MTRTGRTHRVGGMPARSVVPLGAARSAAPTRLTRLDNNANAGDTSAPNDKGEPNTPSQSMPDVQSPEGVVPADRDTEETEAEELHAKTSEGAVMNWFDELGS